MACKPEVLRKVPLFAFLDDEELAVLATQVELKSFAPRQRIYKMGDPGAQAYVVISGKVKVYTVDQDQQEVVIDEPRTGEFFGFASMLEETSHQTSALAEEESECLEVSRDDIAVLLSRKPMAGMDLLAAQGRQIHAAQGLVRVRASRNPNELIEKEATYGERIADAVARFGGSWTFIIWFAIVLIGYTALNVVWTSGRGIPIRLFCSTSFFSMLASVQAPVIMMSQNRQDTKDRLRSELDFDVNRRAENEIQGLAHKLNVLDDKLDDLAEMLRGNGNQEAVGN